MASPKRRQAGGLFHDGFSESRQFVADSRSGFDRLKQIRVAVILEVFQVVNPDGDIEFKTAAELQAADKVYGEKKLVPETRKENLLTVNGQRASELNLAEQPVEKI